MKTSFKTKTTTKKAIAMAMAVTMMFGTIAMPSMFNTSDFLSISASAASGVNSLPTNIKCYPLSTSNNTPAYNSPGATSKSGTIYAADLCTIRAIYSNGYRSLPIRSLPNRSLPNKSLPNKSLQSKSLQSKSLQSRNPANQTQHKKSLKMMPL